MAPPLKGKSLILHPRYAHRISPAGASWLAGPRTSRKTQAESRVIVSAIGVPITMLKGMMYEETLLVLPRLPGGTPSAPAVPGEATDVKDRSRSISRTTRARRVAYSRCRIRRAHKDVVHRHDAHAFVYVLEGHIVMQLKGQPAVTLKAGQTFY